MQRAIEDHRAVFKAKVAKEAPEKDKMVVELVARLYLHPDQIMEWKRNTFLANWRSVWQGY
jgi:hypothetical protein